MTKWRTPEKDLTDATGYRLSARKVDWVSEGNQGLKEAQKAGQAVIAYASGGFKSFNQGQPQTEVLVTVAWPNGDIAQFGARIRANRVTKARIARACLGAWAVPAADPRFGSYMRRVTEAEILKYAESKLVD